MEPLLVIGACCSVPAAVGAVVMAVAGKDEGIKKVRSIRARWSARFSSWTSIFGRDGNAKERTEHSKVRSDR